MPWTELLVLVIIGFVVGAFGTMVGIGGGFILVPIFLFLNQPAKVAAGTSLAVVFANAASGAISYFGQRRVDIKSAIVFALTGVPGAFAGAYVDQKMPHRLFIILFGLLLVAVAARLVFTPKSRLASTDDAGRAWARDFVDAHGVRHRYNFNVWTAGAIGLGVGFLASMFGIGGGVIQVPAMIYLFGFPAHVAVATSTFIIALTSLVGTASHIYFHDVAPLLAGAVAIGAIGGAQVGARLALRLKAPPLLRWLSAAVLIAALWLLLGKR